MKEYKRLTKWEYPNCASVDGSSPLNTGYAVAINRLAELEDKIENGELVELGAYYIKPFAIKKSGLYIIVRIEERGVSGTFEKEQIPEAERLIRKWQNEDTLP